jgi:hypothetical protein
VSAKDFYTDPATVPLSHARPLLVVDADEVLLRFADGFDRFLRQRELYLDFVSYRLHGNVKRLEDESAVLDIEVTALLEEFRAELDALEAVEDTIEVIDRLRRWLDVVVLTNITPAQAPARRRNLDALGLSLPLLVNEGSKGAAVKRLAERAGRPVFFIDDIAVHHMKVAELAPDVYRIHFVGDERLKPLLASSPHAHMRAQTWRDIESFMLQHLEPR